MNKDDVVVEVFLQLLNYNLPIDINLMEESNKLADYLIERSGDSLCVEEIRKCIFNIYEDYLYDPRV